MANDLPARREAFEHAVHSLRLEGIALDLADVPEIEAVIAGKMTFGEAEDAIVAKTRCGLFRLFPDGIPNAL